MRILYLLVAATLASACPPAVAGPLAVPGATGYGRLTLGGRGGVVHIVSSLADSGPGSLRACLEASGPRHCVITASGTIETVRPIFARSGRVSVWGQTSPGGVQIKVADRPVDGRTSLVFERTTDVVLRHIRIRPGWDRDNPAFKRQSLDCLTFEKVDRVMVDHVSCAWAADEGFNIYAGGRDYTIQWSLWSDGLKGHPYGAVACSDAHRGLCGSITWFANAFHKMGRRSPSLKTAGGQFGPHDLINNLISAPGEVGAELWDDHPLDGTGTWANIVGNYAQRGLKTGRRAALLNEGNLTSAENVWYAADNLAVGMALYGVNSPWSYSLPGPTRASPVAPLSVTPWPAGQTKAKVLAGVGAWPRDALDARLVGEMSGATSTGTTPTAAGPWPSLSGPAAPADGDRDGMPDLWERARGLRPNDPRDAGAVAASGYTWLEVYLDERHRAITGRPPAPRGAGEAPSWTARR